MVNERLEDGQKADSKGMAIGCQKDSRRRNLSFCQPFDILFAIRLLFVCYLYAIRRLSSRDPILPWWFWFNVHTSKKISTSHSLDSASNHECFCELFGNYFHDFVDNFNIKVGPHIVPLILLKGKLPNEPFCPLGS